ncbi:MAG TPA: hypothetical protein VHN78_05845, partial [Chloroflexota bacterium]|nr:hypothetical protein [Chloroflexota bacterium]
MRADRLDAVVWAQVRELVLAPERLAAQLGRLRAGASLEDSVLEQQVARLRRLAGQLDRQQERLLDAYQQAVLTLDELAARREHLARQQAEVTAQRTHLEQERLARTHFTPVLAAAEAFRARVAAGLDAAESDVDTQRQVVRLLLEDVVVTGDEVAVHYVIPLTGFSN